MVRISASILGFLFEARKYKIPEDAMIRKINDSLKAKDKEFQILHIDIEDGVFVKNRAYRPSQIRKIKCPKKKEIHMMVVNYKKYIKDFFYLGDMFIVHNEVLKRDFPKTIEFLKKNRRFVGIAINPETPISEIKHLDKIDLVLVMSIHPGLPGQKFIDYALRKIKKLKELRQAKKYRYVIEVDGGINKLTSQKCIDAGADILDEGTALFS